LANWGEFVYGDGTLWGGTVVVYGTYPNIEYALSIDWNNDGTYSSSEQEQDTMLSWSSERGRDFFLNSNGDGLEPVNEGKLTITLDNTDGKYDPFNASSPLYPNVVPGRSIKFIVQDTSTLTNYTVFTGEIDDIRPFALEKTVEITAVDKMRALSDLDVTITLNTDIKVSDAITAILEEAGSTDYDIDSQLDVIAYWWVNQQKSTNAIQELCDASWGTFFIANDGTAKYHKRQRAVSSVLTLAQDTILKDIVVNQPWDVVRNNIDVIVHPLVQQATSTLWTLQDTPSVTTSDTIELWGTYSYNNESVSATGVALASSDYLMNSDAGGGGTNMTSDFTVTADIFGESVKFTITNNAASTGYITLLQIRGDALVSPDPVRLNTQDAASIALYKNRTFKLDSKWLQNTNLGISLSETISGLLSSPRKYPVIRIDTRPDIQYLPDLFDRISMTIAELSVDGAYRIGSIKHESTNTTCQSVLTTMRLEPIIDVASVYWIFPTEIGVTSIFS
jgi:hypothetical protein